MDEIERRTSYHENNSPFQHPRVQREPGKKVEVTPPGFSSCDNLEYNRVAKTLAWYFS
jgi:hypothetical protein